jgi:hypothetical protein
VFESRQKLGIFLFTTASRPVPDPTLPPIQWVAGSLSLGVKWSRREADHPPPSSAEVKNAWSYTSTPQYILMAWCSVKSTGTTLPLPLSRHEHVWRNGSIAPRIINLDGCEWSGSRPDRFTSGKGILCTHWIGSWVGPRAGLDAVTKTNIPSPSRKSNSGRHYTD